MLIVGPNDLGVLKKFDFALLTTVRYPIDNDLDILILWDHLALPSRSPQRRRRTIPRDGLAIELAISHDRLRVINDQNGRSTLCIDPAVQSDIGLYKVSERKGQPSQDHFVWDLFSQNNLFSGYVAQFDA